MRLEKMTSLPRIPGLRRPQKTALNFHGPCFLTVLQMETRMSSQGIVRTELAACMRVSYTLYRAEWAVGMVLGCCP